MDNSRNTQVYVKYTILVIIYVDVNIKKKSVIFVIIMNAPSPLNLKISFL